MSKRFLPSAMSFLAGVIHASIPKSGDKLLKICPPFSSTSNDLVLYKNYSTTNIILQLKTSDLLETEIDEEFKTRALSICIKLLLEFYENFKDLPSCFEIFEHSLKYVQQIPPSNYPREVQDEIASLIHQLNMSEAKKKVEFIVMEKRRPKALRLYEPNIVKVYVYIYNC